MEGKSHRIGGTVAMLGTFEYMRITGGLIEEIHPLVQLAVMYPAASFGAQFPDLDHHRGSIPLHTPAGYFAHWILHIPTRINKKYNMRITGKDKEGKNIYKPINKNVHKWLPVKHRAWQTHSLYFTLPVLIIIHFLIQYWESNWGANNIEILISNLILYGFIVGVVSHLVLDMLTPDGIWLIPNFKFRLVPRKTYFATGNTWEVTICRKFMNWVAIVLAVFVASNFIGYDISSLLYTKTLEYTNSILITMGNS